MNLLSHDITVGTITGNRRSNSYRTGGDHSSDHSSCNSSCNSSNSNTRRRKRGPHLSFLRTSGNNTSIDSESDNSVLSNDKGMCLSKKDYHSNRDECKTGEDVVSTEAEVTAAAATTTNAEDVAELLTQEMFKMSLLDRTDILEEIHGVKCLSVEETPEFLERSLEEFRKELDKLPDSKKKTYSRIVLVTELARKERSVSSTSSNINSQSQPKQPMHYAIEDDNFRLRFLRTELYDAKRAVSRFVNYFEFVNEFWGFEIVSKRHVRLSDFSKEELKFFKKGYFQMLPFRDRSGRRVVVILGENTDNSNGNGRQKKHGSYVTDSATKAKCYFYLLDVASRDSVESQRKGFVAIAHTNGICFDLQNHELRLVHRLSVSVPTRMVVSHNFCHDFSGYSLLAKVVVAHVVSGSKQKQIIRQKFHVGLNDTEILYHLQGFGIPIQFFPLTETGTIKLNYFSKWLKTRNYLEAKEEIDNENNAKDSRNETKDNEKLVVVVECPLLNDVVFRQGKSYKANPGNDVLRDSILGELNRKMMASIESTSKDTINGNISCNKSPLSKYNSGNGLHFNESINYNGNHLTKNSAASSSSSISSEDSTERFCNWFIDEIEINRNGRFLTWDGALNTWVQMLDKLKIRRKISVSLYNYEKRHSAALGKFQKDSNRNASRQLSSLMPTPDGSPSTAAYGNSASDNCFSPFSAPTGEISLPSSPVGEEDDLAFRFIEGGRQFSQRFCWSTMMPIDGEHKNRAGSASSGGGGVRKRSRDGDFFSSNN